MSEEDEDKRISPLRDSDPELYGWICGLSARIEASSGCGLMAFFTLLCAGAIWALLKFVPDSHWSWGIPVGLVFAWAWHWVDDKIEQSTYDQERDELERRARASDQTPETLIALLAGDEEAEYAHKWLKRRG